MAIFFTGNEFYDEPGIIEKFHRPFMRKERELTEEDIENGYFDVPEIPDYDLMKRTLIDNFNQKVHHGDMTFHIGNFGNLKVADELNGDHYLIIGKKEADVINSRYGDIKIYISIVRKDYNFKNVFVDYSMNFVLREEKAYYRYKGPIERYVDSFKLFMFSHEAAILTLLQGVNTNGINEKTFFLSPDGLDETKFSRVARSLNPGVDMHHFFPISEKELGEYIVRVTSDNERSLNRYKRKNYEKTEK